MTQDFVGAGWAFPLRTDASGAFALVRGDREVQEAIRLVLATGFGDRPMRPEFGCGIHDLAFDPADPVLAGRIAEEVEASLTRWEPRIDLLGVDVAFDADDGAVALISVSYALRNTNDPRNLVFPFYVLPPEE